nr:MAG TPA: hypothetical protein [Caudoviricetes sp.]
MNTEAQQAPAARVAALQISPLTGPYETNIRAKWYRISNGSREWEIKNLSNGADGASSSLTLRKKQRAPTKCWCSLPFCPNRANYFIVASLRIRSLPYLYAAR